MSQGSRWTPERFFYSHATKDEALTAIVERVLRDVPFECDVYVAERGLVGRPLVDKLREELLSCNALLVGWTSNACASSEIIAFEVGMAYGLGLPIYMLCDEPHSLPWFFSELTDYAKVPIFSEDAVRSELEKIEPVTYYHPVDLVFPANRGPKGQARNIEVVRPDGAIVLPAGFDDTVHFYVENRRQNPERDVRLNLRFPEHVKVQFDAGSRDGATDVQRNEVFDMWQAPTGVVRLYWPSLSIETFSFELRLTVPALHERYQGELECALSSDRVPGWRKKNIPFRIEPADGADSAEAR